MLSFGFKKMFSCGVAYSTYEISRIRCAEGSRDRCAALRSLRIRISEYEVSGGASIYLVSRITTLTSYSLIQSAAKPRNLRSIYIH
jgi:hypothetical protein